MVQIGMLKNGFNLCNEYVIYANVMEYKSKEIDCYTICEKNRMYEKDLMAMDKTSHQLRCRDEERH